MVLHDRRLQRIDQDAFMFAVSPISFCSSTRIPTLTVGHRKEAVADRNKVHADARPRRQKRRPPGRTTRQRFGNHRLKLRLASSEMKDGTADDDIRKLIWKGHFFNASLPGNFHLAGRFLPTLTIRVRVQQRDHSHRPQKSRTLAQQIDEIAAISAARVKNAHSRARCCRARSDRTRRCRSGQRVPGCSESSCELFFLGHC